jgi:DNA-directed RNA polymerase specialized sigma subunit
MTRQQKAREALISEGISSAHLIDASHLGSYSERNRKIVQAVIFDGETLKEVGKRFGLSMERVRGVALGTTRRAIGRYEGVREFN